MTYRLAHILDRTRDALVRKQSDGKRDFLRAKVAQLGIAGAGTVLSEFAAAQEAEMRRFDEREKDATR